MNERCVAGALDVVTGGTARADTARALSAAAGRNARAAADRYRLRLVEVRAVAEHQAVAALLSRVWRSDSVDQVLNADVIRAFAHSGNYVVAAYQGDRLVGAAIGFFGVGHLHSHVTGVDPRWQGGGVGYALKQHQRAWALARGVDEVRWTFDPLVRRNAHFNLHKLGAFATEYLPAFYGALSDGVNAGDATDRLYVSWRLTSPRAVAAAHGDHAEVDAAAVRGRGATVLVDRAGEVVVSTGAAVPADGRGVLVAVPSDIEALRARDGALAARWRYAVREAITAAFGAGYRICGMSRDGFYVLEVDPAGPPTGGPAGPVAGGAACPWARSAAPTGGPDERPAS